VHRGEKQMFKSITLTGEEFGLQIDRNPDSDIISFRFNDFIYDEEKSKPGHAFYKENNILEVNASIEEVKEIIKALQEILPEEDCHE
jgi:hypothetical protein